MGLKRSNTPVDPISPSAQSSDENFKSSREQLSPTSKDDNEIAAKQKGKIGVAGANEGETDNGADADPKNDVVKNEEDEVTEQSNRKLYKSPRFKGYILILLSSVINYRAIKVSQDVRGITSVVPSSQQVGYGLTVAIISCIVTGLAVLLHVDNWSCFAKTWKEKVFAPKSRMELFVNIFLLLWWFIATCIQTGVRGIAGDGKMQFNIYYSTWFCTLAALFCFESKMTEYGWPTIKTFTKSWPNRAPGWIAIFLSDFFVLFWYVDLYINTAKHPDRVADTLIPFWSDIPMSQYEWLIFVASATLLPAAVFIFAEIFRDTQGNSEKVSLETNVEGICLFLLTVGWIPSVTIATTPGGFASYVGNAYFFTWFTTVFVLETTMWFVYDSRGSVHRTILQKEQEYRQHQQNVLEATRKLQLEAMHPREEVNGRRDRNDSDWRSQASTERRKDTEDAPIFGRVELPAEEAPMSYAGFKSAPTPPTVRPKEGTADADGFEMINVSDEDDDNDDLDEPIKQEIRMKESNPQKYFENLQDILE